MVSGLAFAVAAGGLGVAQLVYKNDLFSPLRGTEAASLSITAHNNPVVEGQRARFEILVESDSKTSASVSFSVVEDGQPSDLSIPQSPPEETIPNPDFNKSAKSDQGRIINSERTLAYHSSPEIPPAEEAADALAVPLKITGDFSTGYDTPERVVEYTFLNDEQPAEFAALALVRGEEELCMTAEVSLPDGSVILKEDECVQIRPANN
ncbi:TPA: hypothetical protein DIS56_02515 [Candidatus Saccharibacteria bacterium]|nr:MAG: hypothetical protein A3F05_03705 [Candidatus Saccharibacteria bacterium RIFCSPHIGHO2_12_FULL_47_17]HCM51983.1 hypothetical protein [Candidatus Saccharibacteria bacterium]